MCVGGGVGVCARARVCVCVKLKTGFLCIMDNSQGTGSHTLDGGSKGRKEEQTACLKPFVPTKTREGKKEKEEVKTVSYLL